MPSLGTVAGWATILGLLVAFGAWRWPVSRTGRRQEGTLSGAPDIPRLVTSAWHGKALDVPWESEMSIVHMWDAHGGKNQQWCFDRIEGGAYVIRSFFTGRCIEIPDHLSTDAAQVRQAEYSGARNQQWMVTGYPDGTYRIHNRHSGKCLDVLGWKEDNGAGVGQWPWKAAENQKWRIEPPL